MKQLKGYSVVKGYAMGWALVYSPDEPIIIFKEVAESDLPKEVDKFEKAKKALSNNISGLADDSAQSVKKEVEELLASHNLIINDPQITLQVVQHIKKNSCNYEFAVYQVFEKWIVRFRNMEDRYLSQRAADLIDIRSRLLLVGQSTLSGKGGLSGYRLERDTIIIAKDLLPSDFIDIDTLHIQGIVLERGGESSHAAILARKLNIPTVIQVGKVLEKIATNDELILDATEGVVFPTPDDLVKEHFFVKMLEYKNTASNLKIITLPRVKTADGLSIDICANLEDTVEITNAKVKKTVAGVGLFRTEYIFMGAKEQVTEEQQFNIYKESATACEGGGVNIRTMDLGGDKLPKYGQASNQDNNPLGFRAIRYCLANPLVFRRQLRAILRASHFGKTRILIPMIACREELEESHKIIGQVKKGLDKDGIPYDRNIEIGIMVEVPSVVYVLEDMVDQLDFISIGTNDLTQYTLAVDRGNPYVGHLYDPIHKSVLHLIHQAVMIAHHAGIKVGVCGEMAGNPYFTPVLVGMGVDSLSMSLHMTNAVKHVIGNISYSECMALTASIMKESLLKRAHKLLDDFFKLKHPTLVENNIVKIN